LLFLIQLTKLVVFAAEDSSDGNGVALLTVLQVAVVLVELGQAYTTKLGNVGTKNSKNSRSSDH
jgi:hypothetical protein